MTPALESGLFALAGAAVGSVVGPWVTAKFAERTRRTDAYKIILVEKMAAVKRIAACSGYLFLTPLGLMEVTRAGLEIASLEDLKKGVVDKRKDLLETFTENAWLLGEDLSGTIYPFLSAVDVCVQAGYASMEENRSTLAQRYLELFNALRGEMHLEEFSRLYRSSPATIGWITALQREQVKRLPARGLSGAAAPPGPPSPP